LPSHLKERFAERQRIAQENGAMILEDPTVALRALSRQRPTFTRQELVQFLESRTGDPAQLDAALAAIMASGELVALTPDGAHSRFTSRDMLDAEKSLMKRAAAMAMRRGHGAPPRLRESAQPPHSLTEEQRRAFEYLVGEGDIKALTAMAGDAKSALLAAVREVWELQGLIVIGVALSRIAAESLHASSGIPSQTLESLELEWQEGRDPLTLNHVTVVDVDKARGKVVLVGDSQQLEAMGLLSPLQSILDKVARSG
jgi:ATP-dependent exoDNAse (exonuclease V) alpha subunit